MPGTSVKLGNEAPAPSEAEATPDESHEAVHDSFPLHGYHGKRRGKAYFIDHPDLPKDTMIEPLS